MEPDSLRVGDKVRIKGKKKPYTLRKCWADQTGWWANDHEGRNHAVLNEHIKEKK